MIAVIDYGLGNRTSVVGALNRLGYESIVSSDPGVLADAEKLILPGVGAFGDGMRKLKERNLTAPLTELVLEAGKPILGICLGFQLIAAGSSEFGDHSGLGWIDAQVVRLAPEDTELRIPHVGWNDLQQLRPSILFEDIPEGALFYYVHSYRIEGAGDHVIGQCDYGSPFPAVIEKDNIYATQFHPEKSQQHGLKLLENFLSRA